MIQRPPISTLFAYTTLFRFTTRRSRPGWLERTSLLARGVAWRLCGRRPIDRATDVTAAFGARLPPALRYQRRSEEHTSELQSRQYLVCRLLLEKKNDHSDTH